MSLGLEEGIMGIRGKIVQGLGLGRQKCLPLQKPLSNFFGALEK